VRRRGPLASLSNQSAMLSGLGRREEALAVIEEAIQPWSKRGSVDRA